MNLAKTVRHWRKRANRSFVVPLAASLLVALAFVWRLGTLTKGFSADESSYLASARSIADIRHNPIYAPHKFLELAAMHISNSAWAVRLPSVIFALFTLALIFYVLRKWFGGTIAALSTFMAATTPWFLLAGRAALPFITLALPLALAAALISSQRSKKIKLYWLLACFASALSIYQPGGLFFVLAILIFGREAIWPLWKDSAVPVKLLGLLIFVIITAPLIYKTTANTSLLKDALGIPSQLPHVRDYAKAVGWSLSSLFVRTPAHLVWSLGRLPVFSIIQDALAAFGIFAMYRYAKSKALQLAVIVVICLLLNGASPSSLFLLPAIVPLFVFCAAGLRYLYFQWHGVFPYNPLPRYLAITVIFALTALQVFFGSRAALIAWPHSNDTVNAYHATIKE